MNLIKDIKKSYGFKAAEIFESVMGRLHLAVPDRGEYTRSWDGGYLVFINPAACVIRLTHKSVIPDVADPHIQRPLGMLHADELRMDLNPGMICPIDPRDARALSKRFRDAGILLWDEKTHNFGYRPGTHNSGEKVPVLIDHASVIDLSQSVSAIQRIVQAKTIIVNEYLVSNLPIKEAPTLATWKDPYEVLREGFSKSWNSDHPQSVRNFWEMAINAKNEGLLVAGWLTDKMKASKYKNAFDGNTLYQRKWTGPFQDQP